MAEDDFFSDNDLDIPDNTLQELEQNAISSTQRPVSARAQPPQGSRKQIKSLAPLNRAGSVNQNLPWRPPQPRLQQQPAPPAQTELRNGPPPSAPEQPSSDYGFDDEDVIQLDEPSRVIGPSSNLQTRPNGQLRPSGAATALYGTSKAALDPETAAAFAAADAELRGHEHGAAPTVQPHADISEDVSALQARIAELEAQQARLLQAQQEARNDASAKQGEVAIVRANQEKWTKEYERRIAVMQKMHADEAAKYKAELEAGRKEREKMETSNRFLQHDLAQESERAKRLNGPGKARAAPATKEKETPRKAKRTNMGDGFDDDEVLVVSPSKSKERAKDQTPKAGAKRKRTAQDSPIGALSFKPSVQPVRQDSNEQSEALTQGTTSPAVGLDAKFAFMQRLLNHRPYQGHDRSVEALAKYFFPSNLKESLSAILMNELTCATPSEDTDSLSFKLNRISLRLWARCVQEQTFESFYLIMDLIHFTLYLELSATVSRLIEEAVPLCMRTIRFVAVPLVQASTNPTFAANNDWQLHKKLAEQVDVDEVMDFLQRLCNAATLTKGRLDVFWEHMEFKFTLLMLNKAQPLSQIMTTLQILATSALPTTFGAIAGDVETQVTQERDMIDRLTSLLFEIPELSKDEAAYTEEEIAELRLEILNVFKAMCLTDHGGLLLAQHRSAIGRLVRFLDGQVNKLYMLPPTLRPSSTGNVKQSSAHDLVIGTVNQTTRLVYHLLRTFDNIIDISQKLNVVHGGYHKFLISMTRVAFSEQLVFENGIEDEVVEAAHTILDNMLSPEEGEAIVKAVETPRGSKGASVFGMPERVDTTEIDDTTMSEPG